jgi:hypothetical protein
MPANNVPKWLFTCAGNGTWTWRSDNAAASGPLRTFDDATMDAARFGFDPSVHYWTAINKGSTTHYRPGGAGVNLRSDEDPPA